MIDDLYIHGLAEQFSGQQLPRLLSVWLAPFGSIDESQTHPDRLPPTVQHRDGVSITDTNHGCRKTGSLTRLGPPRTDDRQPHQHQGSQFAGWR